MTTEQEILTAAEAARFLKVSPRTLRELAASGAIPARKVGREWRFSRTALEKWVSAHPKAKFKREGPWRREQGGWLWS